MPAVALTSAQSPEQQRDTLDGLRAVEDAEPVCHVSLYEADAYAAEPGMVAPAELPSGEKLGAVSMPGSVVSRRMARDRKSIT